MQFAAPSTGGGSSASIADLDGHLVVVEPLEYIASMQTSFGDKDALRVTVHDINTSETHEDMLLFGVIIGRLKGSIGSKVLGIIGRGVAKPGQAAPWTIEDASQTPAAVEAATAYLTGRVASSMTAPAAPAAGPSALDAALGNLASAGLTK